MAINEVRNIERPTDPVHQKIVYSKTRIQRYKRKDKKRKRFSENIPVQ